MMSSASASASPASAVNKYDYDLICIGGGSGGIACAKRASSLHSRRVLCVERQIGKLGGTCVNVGCVPKKVMWTAACIAHTLRHDAAHYGFDVDVDVGGGGGGGGGGGPRFDYAKLKKARDGYVSRLNGIYASGFASAGVACVYGDCSLSLAASAAPGGGGGGGRAAVVLVRDTATGATARYTAEHIVIATGGRPRVPCEDGDGVAEHCITSDGFFGMSELPDVSVVVGAGYVAVELAGVLASLGSEVHLVLRRGKALRDFDPMLSDGLDDEMRRGGIFVHRHTGGVRNVGLDPKSGKKNVTLVSGDAIYGADVVIMAAGRMPNTENLVTSDAMDANAYGDDGDVDEDGVSWSGNTEGMGLGKMGVKLTKNGYVVVDEYQNTSVDGVYAIGDVCGRVELTPMAIAAGRKLADRLFGADDRDGRTARVSYDLVPTVVFSHPTIGTCGLTEPRAIEKYGAGNVRVYTSKFSNLHYGIFEMKPEDKPKTLMKLVCAGVDEKVVGMHVLGMGADEMMQGFGVAMKMGCTKADLDSCVAIHPTASEEFVTMGVWGTSPRETGARVSPLGGAAPGEPRLG